MEKAKEFFIKYGLYILVVGIVLLIIGTTWMNNLPNPYYLDPISAHSKFYVPYKIARVIKAFGIIGLLTGAFIVIRNISALVNSKSVDTDNITRSIAASLSSKNNQSQQFSNNSGIPHNYEAQGSSSNKGVAANMDNGTSGQFKSKVIEVKKVSTPAGFDYAFVDFSGSQIVGMKNILDYLINQGYRIVSSFESQINGETIMQIVIEKQ